MRESLFSRIARIAAYETGKSYTFVTACIVVILWGASGPYFHFSDTWQLVINTSTTIITFLVVFLLQHSQNRDTMAIQLKLDELIASNRLAHNAMLNLESRSEEDLENIRARFAKLADSDNGCLPPDSKRTRGF
jgi:low affinity Fe/Cu permease